eukprot:TRINITY_DN96108_c0_g1_i1.p1 TRINITY_DN96108_c0_g1~~TRINITY_DN96108_c0_g1_i1.p1  ORF type:complete len:251 (+),score=46.25 TRINITY_DN96108_c0_g1_i1:86-838(+)
MSARDGTLLPEGAQDLAGITDRAVRHGFVKKVFGIFGCQMAVTTLIAGLITVNGEDMMRYNPGSVMTLMWMSLLCTVGMMFVFICCPNVMRKSPKNYMLLGLFTVAEAVMVGFICVQYTVQSVLVTLAITAFVSLSLIGFASQTRHDFTGMMPYLFAASMALCAFGFIMMIVAMCGGGHSGAFQTMNMLYAGLGAVLFSGYIVLDVQMIVNGKGRFRFAVDDYCMAAINIYLDIIQLFLYLLQLFGDRRR